ncbi:glutathione S-transferase N-terminal domain-containing protein [Oricola cellulosilytica]|nr:glutathione S-transferase N-terminal domain-containing protein [Oricola cellulosilytica]
MAPILYSFRRCPYAIRARLAIRVAGMTVELREILLREKPEAFLQASPSATVPALVTGDGTVVDESLDIMLLALRENDPEGWLSPPAGSLDTMVALIDEINGGFKSDLDRAKYPNRFPDAEPDRSWERAMARLNGFAPILACHGGWLFGDRASLADMAILPFVRQFAHIDRGRFDAAAEPPLREWLDGFLRSEPFAAVMEKYPVWNPEEPGVRFP